MHRHEKITIFLQCNDNKEILSPKKCLKILDPFPCRIEKKKSSDWGGGVSRRSLVQPLAQNRVCYEIRSNALWLCPARSAKFKVTDISQSLHATCFPFLNTLRGIFFFFKSSWNLPLSIYEYCLLFSHHVTH